MDAGWEPWERATETAGGAVEDGDHGRGDVTVDEPILDGAEVGAAGRAPGAPPVGSRLQGTRAL